MTENINRKRKNNSSSTNKLKKQKIDENNVKNVKQINNLDLVKGIYIAKVTTSNDEILLKKLIIK